MVDDGAIDEINFLSGSSNRVKILKTLKKDGPLRREELREVSNPTRTTVLRNLEQLEKRGWISQDDERRYSITSAGEFILDELLSFRESIRVTNRLQPFLEWLPDDSIGIEITELAEADITVSSQTDPLAALNKHVERVQTADEVYAITSTIGREALKSSYERLENGGDQHELIVSNDAADILRSKPEYSSLLQKARETGSFEVFVLSDEIPYYLGIIDGLVQIGVEDEDGIPKVLLEAEKESVREWAESRYQECRSRAERMQ